MAAIPRVALVGCGRFACDAHLPALRRLEKEGRIALVALCSRSDASLQRARRASGRQDLKTYKALDQLLADPAIDVVDLVLPIAEMPDAIRASLQAGKHVISEKPCAPTVAASIGLLDDYARLEHPPLWAVAENWRFKPATVIIEQLVTNGAIGTVSFADFRYMTFTGPNDLGWRGAPTYQGGSLLDSGVHFIALLRKIVGEVERVSAIVSQRVPHLPPADSVTAVLGFAGGAEGCVRLSWAAERADGQPGLSLTGSAGRLFADFRRNTVELRNAAGRRLIRVRNDGWVQGGVYDLLAHCVDAVRADTPLRSTPWEALRDVAVVEAMLQSSRSEKVVRPASLLPVLHPGRQSIATYDNVWTFAPQHVVECTSVAEVRSAVLAAVGSGLHVRAMGNRYSWAPHLHTRDVCVSVGGLNRIHGVDVTRKTVRVDAGVRLGDLTRALAANGLSLPSLPFVSNASIGGAVATGTHGTSAKWGTVSDCVQSLTLVLASGEVETLRLDTDPEAFRAASVSIGMLGVIVGLELQAVDMPWVRFDELNMDLGRFLDQRAALLAKYDHVWAHWVLGQDEVRVKCLEGRPTPARGFHRYVTGDNAYWENRDWLSRGARQARRVLQRLGVRATAGEQVPPGAMPLADGSRQVWMSMQYGVPATHLGAAVAMIRASAFAKANANRVIEMKFLKGADRSYLGPNADGDAVLFNLWWLVDDSVKHTVFDPFEELMRDLHARPHWGKQHSAPSIEDMRLTYPRWAAFDAVRTRLDPGGTFSIFGDAPARLDVGAFVEHAR